MGKIENDRLEMLFDEMREQVLSANFEHTLMYRISSLENRRKNRIQWLYMLLWPCVGVVSMAVMLLLVDKYVGIEINLGMLKLSFEFTSEYIFYIILAVLILLLLVADTFIRKRLNRKRVIWVLPAHGCLPAHEDSEGHSCTTEGPAAK